MMTWHHKGMLLVGLAVVGLAGFELVRVVKPEYVQQEAAPPNPGTCVVTKCGLKLAECFIDTTCRTWNMCNMKCKVDDLGCQIRCADLYKPTDSTSDKINEFSKCVIPENHCVAQTKMDCKVPENAAKLNGVFSLENMVGNWYITKGWNKLFDCFDCQVHAFSMKGGPKPLYGDMKYSVKKDLNCQAPNCEYMGRNVFQTFEQDPANSAHFINHNNSIDELHFADDWYVIAAKPDTYAFVYYCGCNDATCGYGGAVLYTRKAHAAELAAEDLEDIRAAAAAAKVDGFSFDGLCTPNGAACEKTGTVTVEI